MFGRYICDISAPRVVKLHFSDLMVIAGEPILPFCFYNAILYCFYFLSCTDTGPAVITLTLWGTCSGITTLPNV